MRFNKETQVGTLALIAFGILYGGVYFLKGKKIFSLGDNSYYVMYRQGGVTRGQPVMLNGMKVGEVSKVELQYKAGNQIKAKLDIDKRVQPTTQSVAKLTSGNLLGGRIIDLKLGEGGQPLKQNGIIKGEVTQGFTDEVMETTLPVLNDIRSTSAIINELATSLAKNQRSITSAILNLEVATQGVRHYIETNQKLFDKGTRSAAKVLGVLADERHGVKPVFQNLSKVTEQLRQANIQKSIGHIESTLASLEHIATQLSADNNSLGLLLHDRQLYDEMHYSMREARQLLYSVRHYPSRYLHVSLLGRKAPPPPPAASRREVPSQAPSEVEKGTADPAVLD